MRRILLCLGLLICCGGCQMFQQTTAPVEVDGVQADWKPEYKRSRRAGTGIDPQARDIEDRLGYDSSMF